MTRPRTAQAARALHVERQRYYDAFRKLRAGETIAEFPFTLAGEHLVARDIRPYAGTEGPYGAAFYLCAWFMCHFGRGREAGPRICLLDFKDSGNPRIYNAAGFKNLRERDVPRCPRKKLIGLVWGGIWREDGSQHPYGAPLSRD